MVTEDTLLLVIDAGTSEVRVSLFDLSGGLRARSVRGYAMTFPAPGHVEIDPNLIWEAVVEAIRELEPDLHAVAAISVAAELGTIFLDSRDEPIGNALCWPDKRARKQSTQLAESLGASAVYATTGRILDPELPAVKLLWLRQVEPSIADFTRSMISIKDFLVFRLCGRLFTDEAHASYSMLFDVSKRRWADDILAELGVDPDMLPAVRPATAEAGVVQKVASRLTGLREGTPVNVGGPDGTVGTVGAGLVRPGITVDLVGTADVIFHAISKPLLDPERRAVVNAHLVPEMWAIGGPTGTTGGMLARLSEVLGYGADADGLALLDTEAEEVVPGADGLVCLTSMAGDRFPDWDPTTKGVLFGLGLGHRRAHIARAALEGAAYVLRSALEVYEQLGLRVDEVRIVGGGAKSQVWTQLRADVCGVPMQPAVVHEATSLGAAVLAAVTIGAFPDIPTASDALSKTGASIAPRPQESQAYRALFRSYQQLRSELSPALRTWDRIQSDSEQIEEHKTR
jgi:xylulokinase